MRALILPFHAAPLLVAAAYTVGMAVSPFVGLVGLAMALILTSWFLKYCFVLFDAAVAGEPPPVLSLEMVNPLNEQRPLLALLLVGLVYKLLDLAGSLVGRPAAIAAGAAMILLLPALISVLGVTRSPWQPLSPAALLALVRGLGVLYAWILAGTAAGVAALYALVRVLPPLVTLVLTELACLTFFAGLGGAMHERRVALGITTLTREERLAERRRSEHAAARDSMLARAYSLAKLRRSADAWHELDQWITAHAVGDAAWLEWSTLLAATATWDHAPIADRMANACLSRLVAAGNNGLALEVAESRLAQNPEFHADPAALAVRLAELAGLGGKRALQRRLAGAVERSKI